MELKKKIRGSWNEIIKTQSYTELRTDAAAVFNTTTLITIVFKSIMCFVGGCATQSFRTGMVFQPRREHVWHE